MKALAACGTTNAATVIAGNDIGATGGVQSSTLSKLIDCWMSKADTDKDGIPDRTWDIGNVPVIECPGNNVSNCARMTGVVCATVVYMTGNNPDIEDVPYTMDDWDAAKDCKASSSSRSGADTRCKDKEKEHRERWDCFVERFKLKDLDGAPARFESKTIYWLPGCKPCDRAGGTGGENYGVLAKIPVLVK